MAPSLQPHQRRRSPRLQALQVSSSSCDNQEDEEPEMLQKPKALKRRATSQKTSRTKTETRSATATTAETTSETPTSKKVAREKSSKETTERRILTTTTSAASMACLPRTLETARLRQLPRVNYVLGIDEAGRGPLAGPVVAAAIWAPVDVEGIVDSKQVTNEEQRDRLVHSLLTSSPDLRWAVTVVDAQRIDDINILQATLEAMRFAAMAIIDPARVTIPIHPDASADIQGCYVVTSSSSPSSPPVADGVLSPEISTKSEDENPHFYALIDGNRIPSNMPCRAEAVIKGDGIEFGIAAASLLAKVTRDRLMRAYHDLYPAYNLAQHKGYPTKDHMRAVAEHGASPIHRRTFAPLKHMTFDAEGKVVTMQQ